MLARLKLLNSKKFRREFRSVEEVLSIENHFPPLVRELFSALEPFKGKKASAVNTAYNLALKIGRENAWQAANMVAAKINSNNAPSFFNWALSWEVVNDQPDFGKNPYASLLSFHELGANVPFFNDSGLLVSVPFRRSTEKRMNYRSFVFNPDGSPQSTLAKSL